MTSKPAARKAATKYRLKFVPDAWREWQALDGSIKQALKPLLAFSLRYLRLIQWLVAKTHICVGRKVDGTFPVGLLNAL